jgi:hypothetical protein
MTNTTTFVDKGATMKSPINELTADELQSVCGGDWSDFAWGAALVLAGTTGLLAAPALLGVVVAAGGIVFEP